MLFRSLIGQWLAFSGTTSPAVVHDPGLELDGILGNSFLGRFVVTLDADRRLLHLKAL